MKDVYMTHIYIECTRMAYTNTCKYIHSVCLKLVKKIKQP